MESIPKKSYFAKELALRILLGDTAFNDFKRLMDPCCGIGIDKICTSPCSSGTFSCLDLISCNTDNLPEGTTNLYFTNAKAITALTGQNVSLFTNDAGYITSSTPTSPAAPDGAIQFNNAGSFGGDTTFRFLGTKQVLLDGALYDVSSVSSVSVSTRTLFDHLNHASLNWDTRALITVAGINAVAWDYYILNDTTNVASLNWSARTAADSSAVASFEWQNRTLSDNTGALAASWEEGLRSTSGLTINRPTPSGTSFGVQYFDLDLGIPIWWNGSIWINALGVPV